MTQELFVWFQRVILREAVSMWRGHLLGTAANCSLCGVLSPRLVSQQPGEKHVPARPQTLAAPVHLQPPVMSGCPLPAAEFLKFPEVFGSRQHAAFPTQTGSSFHTRAGLPLAAVSANPSLPMMQRWLFVLSRLASSMTNVFLQRFYTDGLCDAAEQVDTAPPEGVFAPVLLRRKTSGIH